MSPLLSMIVPTRGRPAQLRRLLASLATTADRPQDLEVVLVIDTDDPASLEVSGNGLSLKQVTVPPGLRMGALNMAGYEASAGRYLMLLNDDVIARTPGWDSHLRTCFAAFPDGILLVHVNDTVFQKALCTFPIVSHVFCNLAGGVCPPTYRRYRIDDHIEDIFNLLGVLGERRSLYLPDVIFEHCNHVTNEHGVRQYFSEEATLALDAPLFDELFPRRKELALKLKSHIAGGATDKKVALWRAKLAGVTDSSALRRSERLRVVTAADLANPAGISPREPWMNELRQKIGQRLRETGYLGLAGTVGRKLLRGIGVKG